MYACVHLCMYACMHICMYACMHICMYAFMHVCMYACVHVCMYACLHVCMYAFVHVCMYACVHVCIYASMHVSIDACVHLCMCACMHANMHVCIYACMHVCMCLQLSVLHGENWGSHVFEQNDDYKLVLGGPQPTLTGVFWSLEVALEAPWSPALQRDLGRTSVFPRQGWEFWCVRGQLATFFALKEGNINTID